MGADGTIYLECTDRKLYAINPNGTKKWEYLTAGWSALPSAPALGPDGTIYLGTIDSKLIAINPDGTRKWEFVGTGQFGMPAIGADATIYVGSSGARLYAVNPDGTKKWEFAAGGAVAAPAIDGAGSIYFGSADRNVYAVAADGTLKWTFATSMTPYTPPAIGADGTVYVMGRGTTCGYLLTAIGPGTGSSVGISISAPSPDATNQFTPVTYTVTYTNAAFISLTPDDIVLNADPSSSDDGGGRFGWPLSRPPTGDISVSGAGNTTRTVTVSNCRGNGTLGISLLPGTAFDAQGRPCGPAGPSETFAVVGAPLTVSVSEPSETITNYWPVSYEVEFTGAAHINLQASDVILNTTGTARATASVSGTGTCRRLVTLSGFTGDGTIGITLPAGIATDLNGNPSEAVTGEPFTVSCGVQGRAWRMQRHDAAGTACGDAIGPATPSTRWEFTTGGMVYGVVVDANCTAYFTASDSKLYAVDADGTQKWVFPVSSSTCPAIAPDGTVYVGSNAFGGSSRALFAIDPDGTQKWVFPSAEGFVYSSPVVGIDGTIYAVTFSGRVYAINPDGTQKWVAGPYGGGRGTPAIGPDGTIYVWASNFSTPPSLYALNPDGTLKWRFDGYVVSPPVVGHDGTIYVLNKPSSVSPDIYLYALDQTTGEPIWQLPYGMPSIGPDGTLYAGSGDGSGLSAFDLDGTPRWESAVGAAVMHTAVDAAGTVYVPSDKLYAYGADGTKKWDYPVCATENSDPAIGPDGTIYLAAGSTLVAIGPGDVSPVIAIGPPVMGPHGLPPATYTITYTNAASITLQPSDITLNTTGTVTADVAVSGEGNTTRTVTVSPQFAPGAEGTIGISIAGYTAFDAAGHPCPPAGPSETFTFGRTP